MKKRFFNIILIIGIMVIILPLCVRADSYSEAENLMKNYLDRNEFKNSYNKYLYTNGTNKLSGMISKKEVEITRYDKKMDYRNINYSYLWNSKPYWSNEVNIPIRNNYELLPNDDEVVGTRITQYVNNTTGVYGSGSYADPWIFAPQYKVRIKVNDMSKGYITNEHNSKDINDRKEEVDFVYIVGSGTHKIYINSIGANEYLGSTCGYVVNGINANKKTEGSEEVGGYILISDITRDTECFINFGERPRKINLDDSYSDNNPESKLEKKVLYMSPERGWYADEFGNEQIFQINKNPKRSGYLYEGYYYSSNKDNACSGDLVISKNKMLTTSKTVLNKLEHNTYIYACYKPITYYIAYNCTSGTGTMTNSTHIFNVKKELNANQCTKVGYDFDTWNTKENGTGDTFTDKKEVEGLFFDHEGTLQLFAMWRPKTNIDYKVNHYIQNIDNDEFSLKTENQYSDGTADASKTINPNTYVGFTSPSSQTVVIKADGSTVVNFYYTRNSYKVTFDANGHGTPNPTSETIRYEDNYKLPTISEKGYTLNGWYSEKTNGSLITTSTKMTKSENHSIYAIWTANTYTVKHSCGTGSGTVANKTATYNTTFTSASNTCTKRGYTQSGWTTRSDETNDGYGWSNWSGKWTFVNGEYGISGGVLQLYPQWTANTYTVKYSCGNTSTQTATYNRAFTIASNTCTKKGYTQKGWTTKSNGVDDGYNWSGWSGNWVYINGEYGISGGVLQLYPRWEANTYTIKYSCGTGTGSVASQTVKFDTSVSIAKSGCVKNGYSFSGWTTKSDESNDGYNWTNWSGTWIYDNGQYAISNRVLQLYPMWTICQAGYYSNNGTCQKCADGTYSNSGAASCTNCPVGSYCNNGSKYACPTKYTSNQNAKTINECYISVSAGGYIKYSGDENPTTCAAGTYKVAHKVNYGSTSSCLSCPTGYTSASGATAQNKCYISVSAGKYIGTANSSTQSTCAVGTYKAAHTVYYGSTSSCSSCPSGYTSNSGATAQNRCYVSVSGGKYIGTANSSTQSTCAAGTYKAAHTVNYGSTSSCSSCPSGYTSNAGASAQNQCYISVSAGKYIGTANSTTQSTCAVGTYKAAHTVNYGSTSSCSNCPSGYTSNSGATAQNKCYISVSAGKYIGTANSTTQSTCAAGKYKEAHTVYYGSTSSCSTCPSGYTSTSGATAQNKCFVSVSAGKYIATANSATQTNCAAGKYKEAHTVYYGSTSSCSTCPSGYTSAAASTAQNKCYISVSANKYIATAGSSTQTNCAAGKTSAAHTVYYGNTSSCTACTAGTYSASGGSCTTCTAGYYCTGGVRTACPAGYTSAAGAKTINECYISVSAGKYIATANSATQTSCATGYYKAAHKVNYGSTSSCSQCPSGYRNGAGATSQSNCKRSVAAGYYIASANATSNTACATGYYKAAHTVNYGSTSSCSQCPSGYRNGAGTTAQSNCKRSVAGGYYIASANATSNTACATGYYKAAHTVNYGSTSSCSQCPSGYRNGAGATSQSNCKRSVSGGYYIASANATSNTICPAGKYKAAHTVNYGSTSSCSSCPSGTTSPAGSDASSDCVSTSKTFKGTFKTGNFSVTTQEKTCTTTSSSCSITSPTFSQNFYNNYSDLIAEAGWNKTNNTNDASYYSGQQISISANTTFYSSLYLQSSYFSSSSNNGTNGRSCASTSCGIVNGLNIGHTFVASGWAYAKNSGCSNNLWLYGYSEEEGWTGYVCSYYTYPW